MPIRTIVENGFSISRGAIKYEALSIWIHGFWSYCWMWIWSLPFGEFGRYTAGIGVIIFLGGNEFSTVKQVRSLLFHVVRAFLGLFFVMIVTYLIRGIFCGTVPEDAEALQRAKAACLPGYHFITHIGILSGFRAAFATGAFCWIFAINIGDFLYYRYLHNPEYD